MLPDILFKPSRALALPSHLQIETTTACNLNCLTCPRSIRIDKQEDMNFETFKMIYDQIKPLRINLSGLGEPLASKDIFKISSYAFENGSLVNFPTNFTLANKHADRIIQSGISQIKVSIDAANPKTYFRIRGVEKFDEIVESIRALNRLKKRKGLRKPEIRFNIALMKDNINELTEIVDLAYRLNVGVIYFQDLVYIDLEDKKKEIVGGLNAENLKKYLSAAEKSAKNKGIKTNLGIWLKDLELYSNKMEPIEIFKPNMRICYFPWFSTYIEVNGNVRPCPHVGFKADEGIMGNVFKESFKNIWDGDIYRAFRRDIKNKQRPFAVCQTCIPKNMFDIMQITSKLLPKNSFLAEKTNRSGGSFMPDLEKDETIRGKMSKAQKSPLKTYIALTSGGNSFIKFVLYELLTSLLGPIPGAVGFFLRQKLYPSMFRKAGQKPIFGRNIVIRHPDKIEIGDHVTIDDNSLIDAHGAGSEGILIEDQVIINRNCLVQAKAGPIRIGKRSSIGSYSIITSVGGIEIGEAVLITGRCILNPGSYHSNDPNSLIVDRGASAMGPIKIEDNTYIRVGAMVVEGVKIGSNAVIGPGAIVETDVPSKSVVRAAPAVVEVDKQN
jgi:radical SAM protein with 4Fe4S-binding SPASM domain